MKKAPAWDRSSDNYEQGKFEPIISALSRTHALSEQIIAEVSSGMSRTQNQLDLTFSQSLAAKQKILPDVKAVINQMLTAGMLALHEDEEAKINKFILRATRLGRIASRHFLEPSTVLLFRRALAAEQLTFFDLLLICACTMDCEPVMPCDYEELEELSINLNQEPSFLLEMSKEKIVGFLDVDGKRLLASLKMSLLIRQWCRSGEVEKVAEKYNCYPFEIFRLRESFVRLLTAMSAVVEKPIDLEETDEFEFCASYDEKIRTLMAMVDGGLDEYAATLTMIKGVGPKLANRLKDAGINDLLELSKTDTNLLTNIPGIKRERLKLWIIEAKKQARIRSASELFEIAPHATHLPKNLLTGIDPYRLRRAMELKVKGADGSHLVTGGTEPHIIQTVDGKLICDCIDFQHRNDPVCKHIFAVRLYRGDSQLQQAVKKLNEVSNKKPIDIFELWFAEQKSFGARKTI